MKEVLMQHFSLEMYFNQNFSIFTANERNKSLYKILRKWYLNSFKIILRTMKGILAIKFIYSADFTKVCLINTSGKRIKAV